MTDSESIMPVHCPEGFDANTWEKVKGEELNDSFLLLLANELLKLKLTIIDVCNCLDIKDSNFVQEVSRAEKLTCYDYHEVLGKWRHLAGNEKELVGKLVWRLSKLQGIECESLCTLCEEVFKSQGSTKFMPYAVSDNHLRSICNYIFYSERDLIYPVQVCQSSELQTCMLH